MVAIYHTAYPRIKKDLSPHEVGDVYTPTDKELCFALRHCKRTSASYLGLLVQLKLVQRLGRFVTSAEVPEVVANHVRVHSRSRTSRKELQTYFASGAKIRHVKLIRQYLKIQPYDSEATGALVKGWALEAAATKEALADVINVTLEYLVKEKYELPAFSALDRICQSARREVNNKYYDQLCGYLTEEGRQLVGQILESSGGTNRFGWNALKNEPKRPTPRNIQAYITYLEWLTSLQKSLPTDLGLPTVKHRQFINEAKALDYAELTKLKANKRMAMMIVLIRHQYAQTLDKAAEIVIKLLQKMDRTAEKKLEEYLAHHQQQTDRLIATVRHHPDISRQARSSNRLRSGVG